MLRADSRRRRRRPFQAPPPPPSASCADMARTKKAARLRRENGLPKISKKDKKKSKSKPCLDSRQEQRLPPEGCPRAAPAAADTRAESRNGGGAAAAAANSPSPPPDPSSVPAIDPVACDARMRAVLEVREMPEDAHAANAICKKMLDVFHSSMKQLLLLPLDAKLASDVIVALVQPLIDHGPELKKLLRQTMSGHVKKLSKILENVQSMCIRLATLLTLDQRRADVQSLRELGDTLCRLQVDVGTIPYDRHSRTLHLTQLGFCGLLIQSLAANTAPAAAASLDGSSSSHGSSGGGGGITNALADVSPITQRCIAVFDAFNGGASALSLDMLLYLLQLPPQQLAQHKGSVATALHARIVCDMRLHGQANAGSEGAADGGGRVTELESSTLSQGAADGGSACSGNVPTRGGSSSSSRGGGSSGVSSSSSSGVSSSSSSGVSGGGGSRKPAGASAAANTSTSGSSSKRQGCAAPLAPGTAAPSNVASSAAAEAGSRVMQVNACSCAWVA